MTTHSSLYKRKPTGGKKRANRTKKIYEAGGYPAETVLGEPKRKIAKTRAETPKLRL
jgi:ribosomal protein S8E